jgi:hypothetical protein
MDVPYYEPRFVTIRFPRHGRGPYITADSPATSPHRFDDGTLCLWHPADRRSRRWVFEDGLLDLLDAIVGHLFREAWWRETGEWLGDEVPHTGARDAA